MNEVFGWDGPLTHRQYLAWSYWLDEQWNRPSRSDRYVQQVGFEVRRANSKYPGRVKFEHLELKFTRRGDKPRMSKEHAARLSKAKWIAAVSTANLPVQHVVIPRPHLEDPPAEMTSDACS